MRRSVHERTEAGRHTVNPIPTRAVPPSESTADVRSSDVLIDLDEIVRLQRAAEDDADRLGATLDLLLDPHIVIATLRDEVGRAFDFRFVDVNRAAAEYLGRPQDSLIGRSVRQCFPESIARGLIEHYLPAADGEGPLELNDRSVTSALTGGEIGRAHV